MVSLRLTHRSAPAKTAVTTGSVAYSFARVSAIVLCANLASAKKVPPSRLGQNGPSCRQNRLSACTIGRQVIAPSIEVPKRDKSILVRARSSNAWRLRSGSGFRLRENMRAHRLRRSGLGPNFIGFPPGVQVGSVLPPKKLTTSLKTATVLTIQRPAVNPAVRCAQPRYYSDVGRSVAHHFLGISACTSLVPTQSMSSLIRGEREFSKAPCALQPGVNEKPFVSSFRIKLQ
jgi:hypothetical protein